MLYALFLQKSVTCKQLLISEAVFGIPRIVHDPVTHLENPARIVPAAHRLRQPAEYLFHKFNVREVI